MRTTTILQTILVSIISMSAISARSQGADAKLTAFFRHYLDENFQQRPMEATQLGDHRFDHLLDDLSPPARAAWVAHARKTLEDLPKQIDYKVLSRAAQIDFEIFAHQLTTSLWLDENFHP